jgi:AAA+ superfamily predicted ATPase
MMGGMFAHGVNAFQTLMDAAMPASASETRDAISKAWLEVQWQGNSLDVLVLHIQGEGFQKIHTWLLADTEEIARGFFSAVSRWNAEIRSEVLVFDNGCWYKDEHLFQDIKNATFENLILRGNLKQEILDDLVQFFAARALYEEHDVPWKRGILFVGPAGNGKTHTIKALINSLDQPCLYVKSFRAAHAPGADEFNIRQVFDRARRTSPCVLVLEDLDSLLTSENRSFFLNELDGFASNIGIVTLATTNHPERLDPSILDRPSRFDRKYPFDLPEEPERRAYITMWNESLKLNLRLSEEGVAKISELTSDFSFAYLKELFLSSKMRWIAHPQQGTMEQVMIEQVDKLREQMLSANTASASETPEELEGMPAMFRSTMARSIMFQQRLHG